LKRVPTALELDLKDPTHIEFIQSGANIFATLFNIPLEKDAHKVIDIARKVKLVEYVPRGNVKIEIDDKKKEEPAPPIVSDDDDK
jgi:ubiquitin-activating enzyme E1